MFWKSRYNLKRIKEKIGFMLPLFDTTLSEQQVLKNYNLEFRTISDLLFKVFNYKGEVLEDKVALFMFYELHQHKESLVDLIIKKGAYPCFLYILSLMLMVFFDIVFGPRILTFTNSLMIDSNALHYWLKIVHVACVIHVGTFLIVLIFLLLLKAKDLRYVFFIRYSKSRLMRSINLYITYQYCYVLVQYIKTNAPTNNIVHEMRQLASLPSVQWNAFNIEANLERGNTFLNAVMSDYLDPTFNHVWRSGYQSQDTSLQLEKYLVANKTLTKMEIEKIIQLIKGGVYANLALIIGLYYYFMLQPMRMMEVIG